MQRVQALSFAGTFTSTRNGSVDAARFIGALGIVWFHEQAPFAWIGYAALPMFMAFVLYFSLSQVDAPATRANVMARGRRLLLPWLAWSVIYGLAKVADALVGGVPISSEFEIWMLLTGTKIHLWFLPFAFVAGLLMQQLMSAGNFTSRRFGILSAGFLAYQVVFFWLLTDYDFGRPLHQWMFVMPACYLGFMLRLTGEQPGRLLTIAVMTIAAVVLANAAGWNHGGIQMVIATLLCVLAIAVSIPASPLTDFLASLSLGIYLIHPFFHAVLMRLIDVAPGTWTFTLLVAGLSILAVAVMKQTPFLRRIV